jgi:DNA-binding MarR family transcriptional regulator
MTQWKKMLKTLGLSDSESALYLASLEAGPATVQDLAKQAGVSRVTTYAVIDSLSGRGLMSSLEKGKKRLFVAESPDRLITYVSKQVREMEASLKEAEQNLSDLKLIQRGEKPVVKMFEGKDALKAIMTDVVATRPESIEEWGNMDEILSVHPREELQMWYREREKSMPKDHRTRSLLLAKKEQLNPSKNEKEMLGILAPELFSFGGDIFVYGNKVAFSTFRGKQISVLIESEGIAETVRQLLNYVWSLRKNQGKK